MKIQIIITDGVIEDVLVDRKSSEWAQKNLSLEIVDFNSDTGKQELLRGHMEDSSMVSYKNFSIDHCEG